MEFDDQMRRFFGTDDLGAVSPAALASGVERMQVEFGLETDKGRKFAMWSLLYMLGSAPDLDVAFKDERDRDAARTFMDLLDPLGFEVDVVLETSHNRDSAGHTDLYREHIDMPVLKSTLWDYEDLLLGDGCTGIAVLNPSIPQEVQFDEHKLLIVYGNPLADYEQVFRDFGVVCDEKIKFITEAEHVHSSSDKHFDQFEEMRMRLGMDAGY